MLPKEKALELKKQYDVEYQQIEEKLALEDSKEEFDIDQFEYDRLEKLESKLGNKLDALDTIIDAYEDIQRASTEFLESN